MARSAISNRFLQRDMGTCLQFNGTSAFVDTTYAPIIAVADTFTVSLWAKIPRGETGTDIVLFGSTGTSLNQFWPCFYNQGSADGKPCSYLSDSDGGDNIGVIKGTQDIRDAKWHHWCFVKNGTSGTLYIDGALVGTDTGTDKTAVFTSKSFYIGARNNNGGGAASFSKALIDEASWIDSSLTLAQVQELYYKGVYPTSTKTFWYKFDEGSGSTATDSSGNARNGTITSATYSSDVAIKPRSASTNRVSLKPGSALVFSTGTRVQVKAGSILSGQTNMTIMAWVKGIPANQPSSNAKIYSERNSSSGNDILNFQFGNATSPNRLILQYRDDAGTLTSISSSFFLPSNIWSHVAMVKTGTAVKFYINGYYSGSGVLAGTDTFTNSVTSLIGNDPRDGNSSFTGSIDDVQISTAALTETQVKAGMNGATISSCVGRWKFDEGSGTAVIDSTGTQANGTITGATYTTSTPFGGRTAIT